MKKKYMKPSVLVTQLQQHRTILLQASNEGWDVINPGQANAPAGVREYVNEGGSGSTGGSIWDEEW